MKDYELTLLIDPQLSGEKKKKFLAKIKRTVKSVGGKVDEVDEWGKKELAYPLKKQNRGLYFMLTVGLPEDGPQGLANKMKMDGELWRYLLVKREKTQKDAKVEQGAKHRKKLTWQRGRLIRYN
jgi:small subunit ribosomal protein S6